MRVLGKVIFQGKQVALTLQSVTTLSDRLVLLGPDSWLWGGADLARVYRQIRIYSLSVPLLGILVEVLCRYSPPPLFYGVEPRH